MNKKSDSGYHRHIDWINAERNRLVPGGVALAVRAEALNIPASYCTELAKGEILRFDESSNLQGLHVVSGTVWLTESPAGADHLLTDGSKFRFSNRWPVIVEALSMVKMAVQS